MRVFLAFLLLSGCFAPQNWPASPLYTFQHEETENYPQTEEEAMEQLAGRYAHYDIVAYEDNSTETPIKSFVISYAFTDLYIQNQELYQKDTFLYSKNIINQAFVETVFSEAAAQAIKPRVQKIELTKVNGVWQLYKPPTPTLLGIKGDPDKPLAKIKNDPNFTDPDKDGNPGVTVHFKIAGIWNEEMYITRREIFTNMLVLQADGSLTGYVIDESEQFVIDATMAELKQESNPMQHPDMGLSPLILVPIDKSIDTIEEFKQIRDSIFPQEPAFN